MTKIYDQCWAAEKEEGRQLEYRAGACGCPVPAGAAVMAVGIALIFAGSCCGRGQLGSRRKKQEDFLLFRKMCMLVKSFPHSFYIGKIISESDSLI